MLCFLMALWSLLVGCGADETANRANTVRSETLPEDAIYPGYSEHLTCTLRDGSKPLQHLYRLNLASAMGEFVGGQGGGLVTLQSSQMQVFPDHVVISFEVEPTPFQEPRSVEPFWVYIHRQTLAYQLSLGSADWVNGTALATLSGKCALLDGENF